MKRVAHHRRAHDGTRVDQLAQLRCLEAGKPRPQSDERRHRRLRLQAAEAFDRVDGGQLLALEQQLPCEQSSIQVALGELSQTSMAGENSGAEATMAPMRSRIATGVRLIAWAATLATSSAITTAMLRNLRTELAITLPNTRAT